MIQPDGPPRRCLLMCFFRPKPAIDLNFFHLGITHRSAAFAFRRFGEPQVIYFQWKPGCPARAGHPGFQWLPRWFAPGPAGPARAGPAGTMPLRKGYAFFSYVLLRK